MSQINYPVCLAEDIDEAVTAAEKAVADGTNPYAYVVGWLIGSCPEEQQGSFRERMNRANRAFLGLPSEGSAKR